MVIVDSATLSFYDAIVSVGVEYCVVGVELSIMCCLEYYVNCSKLTSCMAIVSFRSQ